jgi:broad specificity phosphatase PhoE
MSEQQTEESRHLILIKHSAPTVIPGVPPAQWVLSDEGRRRCTALATRLARVVVPGTIAASDEPKARETAELLAAQLGFDSPVRLDHDLREHERQPADFFASQAAFEAAVQALFARPDDLVFGQETARAAGQRFDTAVRRILAGTPSGDVIVVAHGTVIALFVAAHAGLAPFPLWQSLQLPAYVVLTLPELRWVETVPSVAADR